MNKKINILLAGVGGQGTILASRVIASLAQSRGLEVKLSEVHGMAQRGGSVVTYLRMGERIYSPLIERGQADIILAFEQLEAWRALPFLKEGGTVVVNSQIIYPVPVILGYIEYPPNIIKRLKINTPRVIEVDAPALAREAGNDRTVNVVLLGVLARQMEFSREEWEKALNSVIPAKILEPNLKAFQLGYGEG